MSAAQLRLLLGGSMLALLAFAQSLPPGIGKGWMGEFDHAASQINALANATPAEKFSWRPAPGVRSVSEVYVHLAVANYILMAQAGVKLPPDIAPKATPASEKKITAKADVIQLVKDSQDFVRANLPKLDRAKPAKLFGTDTNVDGILLRILVHNHEHMGQSIAYARSIGVVPPWSQTAGQ